LRARLNGPIIQSLRWLNARLRSLSAGSHHLQYKAEGLLQGSAEWFDHEIDAHWQWRARRRPMFLERGILNMLAIRPGAHVLEICCGDGFYADRFYAGRAAQVLAVDHNALALRHARRFHACPNVEYRRWDIREGTPGGPFDNVVWDSAMHHFTLSEVSAVLASVHRSLAPGGVLSGCTEIVPGGDYSYARLRFTEPQQLAELLQAAFAHVAVLETPDPERRNLYFFASDLAESLPFAEGINQPLGAVTEPAG
jgi:SAM-dependent methyltransferase